METCIIFLRFTPLSAIRDFQRRACQARHLRPSRLPCGRTRRRFRLEMLEVRCLLSGISSITEFPLPSGSGGVGITSGPDGNLWFADAGANKIGMINPTTHAISEFTVPTANAGLYGITPGPDGNLWFTEWRAGKIGMINPTTDAISEFTVIAGGSSFMKGITAGPDGNLWFGVTASKIGMINPTTHAIAEFTLPSFGCCGIEGGVWGFTSGPNDTVWFMESTYAHIGMINTTTHVITEFALPSVFVGHSGQWAITTDPDDNLWFTSYGSQYIGEFNPTTLTVSDFAISSYASGITLGPDGNLWFTENAGTIGRINPTTGALTEYPVPAGQITTGPDGNLWFTYGSSIGVATLSTTETDLVVTQQPPTSITAGSGFALTVQAEDGSGNLITSFNGTVTVALASNPGNGTLGGTLTATATNGVATFSGLTITNDASGYTLVATSGLSGEGFTSAITVTPAAATQLVITEQPPATVGLNSAFGLEASIEDQYGNVVTTATNTVSVAFATNSTGATLGGTRSVTASQGVASFSNLTINKTGSSYTLRVSSSGLGSAVSSAISVTEKAGSSVDPGMTTTENTSPSAVSSADTQVTTLTFDSPVLSGNQSLKKRGASLSS